MFDRLSFDDRDYLASLYAIAVSTPDGDRIGFIKFED